MIKEILSQLFTESDNQTHSLIKYLVCGGTAAALFYQGWDTIANNVVFNMQSFGIGVGAMWSGAAAALYWQRETPAEHRDKEE